MTTMFERALIANRGEIAIRIARAAAGLGVKSLAVFAPTDAKSRSKCGCHNVKGIVVLGGSLFSPSEFPLKFGVR